MGFRFHKSLSLIPGLKLNLSKSGPSVSVGSPGATYNIGMKRQRETVSLPGSGLSYSTTQSNKRPGTTAGKIGMMVVMAAAAFALHYFTHGHHHHH